MNRLAAFGSHYMHGYYYAYYAYYAYMGHSIGAPAHLKRRSSDEGGFYSFVEFSIFIEAVFSADGMHHVHLKKRVENAPM